MVIVSCRVLRSQYRPNRHYADALINHTLKMAVYARDTPKTAKTRKTTESCRLGYTHAGSAFDLDHVTLTCDFFTLGSMLTKRSRS